MTPTARTLALLRRSGYVAEVVERWLPIPGKSVRRDLFGVGDILAVGTRERRLLLVQVTTRAHLAHRQAKARHSPGLKAWLAAGGRFQLHGWYRLGGGWQVKVVELRGEDLQAMPVGPARRRVRRPRQATLFD